jgi:hypothetical protein
MNAYKDLRKKSNELMEDKSRIELDFNERIELEKEKNEILNREIKSSEEKILKLNKDLKIVSDSNRNLIIELKSINTILDEVNKQKENFMLEISYYKNELEI